jgi:hypothetical protein
MGEASFERRKPETCHSSQIGFWDVEIHESLELGNTVPGAFTPVLAKASKASLMMDFIVTAHPDEYRTKVVGEE